MSEERVLKYVVIGDSGCGKSSFLNQYMTNQFDENITTTIGVEFYIRRFIMDEISYKLHIWDLAGQERFKAIARSYYRNCDGIFLMFDLSDYSTFENMSYWYNEMYNMYELEDDSKYNPSIFLIGNKNDLSYRQVETNDIEKFIDNKIITNYMECSAKTGDNVCDIFDMLNRTVHDNIVSYKHYKKVENVINLSDNNKNNEKIFGKKYCCYF